MTIDTIQNAGPDKVLRLHIPVDQAGGRYHVIAIVEQQPGAVGEVDANGWPAGFWDRVAGSISDPTFVRPPQGDPDARTPLE